MPGAGGGGEKEKKKNNPLPDVQLPQPMTNHNSPRYAGKSSQNRPRPLTLFFFLPRCHLNALCHRSQPGKVWRSPWTYPWAIRNWPRPGRSASALAKPFLGGGALKLSLPSPVPPASSSGRAKGSQETMASGGTPIDRKRGFSAASDTVGTPCPLLLEGRPGWDLPHPRHSGPPCWKEMQEEWKPPSQDIYRTPVLESHTRRRDAHSHWTPLLENQARPSIHPSIHPRSKDWGPPPNRADLGGALAPLSIPGEWGWAGGGLHTRPSLLLLPRVRPGDPKRPESRLTCGIRSPKQRPRLTAPARRLLPRRL